MPSLLRSLTRALAAVAVALLALSVWSAQAQAPPPWPGIEVTVNAPEGDSQQILFSEIKNRDIVGKFWFPGKPAEVDVTRGRGISIYEILAETGTEKGYRNIQFQGPGGVIELTNGQVRSAEYPPFFYLDPDGTVYFVQPTDGPKPATPNGYFPLTNAPFSMTQLGGAVTVELKASRKKIEPGESVTFTATATPRDDYRYDWTFGQGIGRSNKSSKQTYTFKKAGEYQVAVGVYLGDDRDALDNAGVRIQVGDPKKSEKDREGGGDNTASDAPSSGTYSGDSGGGSYTPDYTPTPVTPAPTPAPTPTPEPPELPDIATSGTTVEGNLLADVSDPPPSNILESAARAARGRLPKDSASDGGGVSEAAISMVGVLGLLALGAGIETRQGRLPRPRLPRRAA